MSSSDSPKTIFITGASSGIGLASALIFYSHGWNIVATMRTPTSAPEPLSSFAKSSSPDSSRILITRLDLTEYETIEPAIKQAVERFGQVDVLLNNAGFGQQGLFEAVSREKIKTQFDVNLFGLMDVTRLILPHFRASKSGTPVHGIVNVSSGAGFWGLPISTMYTSSKFALEGFTESLSYELLSQNIFVKSVIPHGGVSATSFLNRTWSEMPQGELKDYDEFMANTTESYKKMIGGVSISSEDVAKKVLEAVQDGYAEGNVAKKERLRYWIGNDARGFVKTRYSSKDDEEYMNFMRGYFQ